MKSKKLLFIVLASVVWLSAIAYAVYRYADKKNYFCAPSPMECTNPTLKHSGTLKYKTASSYYVSGLGGYQCSRPIRLKSDTVNRKGEAQEFIPVDPAEAKLLCHMTSAEEYEGKIKVLQKPDVISLISQYEYKDMSIKALEFKYIKDTDYVHRLLPGYKNEEIGCIIVLDTPGQDKVYLEDEELETFEELDYKTFVGYLEQVSPADRKLFYDNLK